MSGRTAALMARWRPVEGEHRELPVTPLPATANSVALITAKVVSMGLGGVFWVLAARVATPAQVGLAAGAVSAMFLGTQVAILGFGSAVIVHLRANRERLAQLLNSALTLVVCLGVAVSVVFLLLAGAVLTELSVVTRSPAFAALFVSAVVFGTVGILLDQSVTGLRRGDKALVRNVVFGTATLLGLVAVTLSMPTVTAQAMFLPWAAAGALATPIAIWQVRRSLRDYRPRLTFDGALSRRLVRSALPNYLLTLADRSPALILPILVTELLSPDANAIWYGVWMMAFLVYTVPVQIGLTVFSEIALEPEAQARSIRRGIRSSLGFGLLVACVVALSAELLLGLLGEHYADGGVTPLRILVVGLVPLTFVQMYQAFARTRGRIREATAIALVSAAISVTAPAAAALAGGLTAMAAAWVMAQVPTALWSAWRLRTACAQGGTR